MSKYMKGLVRKEDGATAIEYGLIAALIAVAIIVGATALGSSLNSIFSSVSTTVDDASPN
jgi:pilus assembly protein Flp/PilA